MLDWLRHIFGAVAEGIGKALGDIGDKLVWEGFFNRHVPETPSRNGWGIDHGEKDEPDQDILDWLYKVDPSHFVDHEPGERDMDRAPGIDL